MNCAGPCRRPLRSILVLTTALLLAGACLAQGTFVSFDGPNAGTQQYHGTFPVAIGRWGGVLLMTIGDNGVAGAYVRHPNGSYLQIQPPPGGSGVSVAGINASGQVAGAYWDSQNNEVGFIRNTDGTYVTLNPPGSNGTTVAGINDKGQVAGNASIAGGTGTPFFWDPAQPSTYVTFSVPGGTHPYAVAINASGQIAGSYAIGCCQTNGFLRNTDGTTSTFTLPPLAYANLQINAMNKWGTILCSFFDENGSDSAVLLRYSGGGKKYVFGNSHGGLNPAAVSDKGVVVGTDFPGDVSYGNAFSIDRTLHETLIPIPFTSQGSTANAVNSVGQMTGTYIDANGASHGWIYLP